MIKQLFILSLYVGIASQFNGTSLAQSNAESMDVEIDFLINSVGRNGCAFVRNNHRVIGRDARSHLHSKRRLNAHLINNTEEFITKIVSSSATSGQAYLIRCSGQEEQTANNWFSALLAEYRNSP